ncbi:MAG: P-loop NTPase [Methanomicrobiales archaeon]|nr:P-loop NTPase [Methanomicrobiales archaeon]MDI6876666.1 P-loop NTPase [Methanomicrobiales archaeon]
MKIAVSGKGGVGKTFVAGTAAWLFARQGQRVLAIDADSSPNLGIFLGLSPEEAGSILPLSENQELIALKTGTGYPGVYSLTFSVEDIVERYAVRTPSGVDLLVMGTVASMGSGCTCAANAVLRALLRHVAVQRDEAVILDMEGGVEHLGRGTADRVDVMLVVTDANVRSLHAARKIARLSAGAGIRRTAILANMIEDADQARAVREYASVNGLECIGQVPFDRTVREAGIRGTTIFPDADSPAIRALERILDRLKGMPEA